MRAPRMSKQQREAEALRKKVEETQAWLQPLHPEIDPGDLALILESHYKKPGQRQFFIFPLKNGGYGF